MASWACKHEGGTFDQSSCDWAEDLARKSVTTLMIKNLPTKLHQSHVVEEIHDTDFCGKYDFYMPGSFKGPPEVFGLRLAEPEGHPKHEGLCESMAKVQGRDVNAQSFGPRIDRIRSPLVRPVILGSAEKIRSDELHKFIPNLRCRECRGEV